MLHNNTFNKKIFHLIFSICMNSWFLKVFPNVDIVEYFVAMLKYKLKLVSKNYRTFQIEL